MIKRIYPIQDTFIDETNPLRNRGIDQILELHTTSLGEKRILLKFPLEETGSEYILKLHNTTGVNLPTTLNFVINPISGSWDMGLGRNNYNNSTGSNWLYRTINSKWLTGSYVVGSTGSYSGSGGGGNWYINDEITSSYDYGIYDVNVNITPIVNNWLSGSYPNDGIIIRFDEDSKAYNHYINFFSKESHTIYSPTLLVKNDDSVYNTPSGSTLITSDYVVDVKLRPTYKEGSKHKVYFKVRKKYEEQNFVTSSMYITNTYHLPPTTYYGIIEKYTKYKILDIDEQYTKVSCDNGGNFFWLDTNQLQVNRIYNIFLKIVTDDTNIFEINNSFKVIT